MAQPAASPSEAWHDYGASHELLDYVNVLEGELERLISEVHATHAQRLDEEARLRQEADEALKKVHQLHGKLLSHRDSDAHAMETACRLMERLQQSERIMQERLKEEKELESRVESLELELEKKNKLIKYRRERDERAIKELEAENEALKRKSAVSITLGYLTDLYLQLQPEGNAAPVLKVVQKIYRELENQNLNISPGAKQAETGSDHVENEIKRLIDAAGTIQKDEQNALQQNPSSRRASVESSTSKKVIGSNKRMSINRGEQAVLDTANDANVPDLSLFNK